MLPGSPPPRPSRPSTASPRMTPPSSSAPSPPSGRKKTFTKVFDDIAIGSSQLEATHRCTRSHLVKPKPSQPPTPSPGSSLSSGLNQQALALSPSPYQPVLGPTSRTSPPQTFERLGYNTPDRSASGLGMMGMLGRSGGSHGRSMDSLCATPQEMGTSHTPTDGSPSPTNEAMDFLFDTGAHLGSVLAALSHREEPLNYGGCCKLPSLARAEAESDAREHADKLDAAFGVLKDPPHYGRSGIAVHDAVLLLQVGFRLVSATAEAEEAPLWLQDMLLALQRRIGLYNVSEVEQVFVALGILSSTAAEEEGQDVPTTERPQRGGRIITGDQPQVVIALDGDRQTLFQFVAKTLYPLLPLCPVMGLLWKVVIHEMPDVQSLLYEGAPYDQSGETVSGVPFPSVDAPPLSGFDGGMESGFSPVPLLQHDGINSPMTLITVVAAVLRCSPSARHRFDLILRRQGGYSQPSAQERLQKVLDALDLAAAGYWPKADSQANLTKRTYYQGQAKMCTMAAIRGAMHLFMTWSSWSDSVLEFSLEGQL